MTLFERPLVVVDCETTGFSGQSWCCLIELGFVLLDVEGKELAAWESLVRPKVDYDPRMEHALRVNGIPWDEKLLSAPLAASIASTLLPWLSTLDHEAVAFPTPFDARVLRDAGVGGWRWGRCLKQRAGKGSLEDVADRLDVPAGAKRHRALADARLAGRVAVALARRGEF